MPKLQRNIRVISSAIAGTKMVYQIDGVPGLNLAALGGGKASWRLRYRPARGAEKRWHTIGDARTLTLGDAMDKARELMSALQIDGIDPKAAQEEALAAKGAAVEAAAASVTNSFDSVIAGWTAWQAANGIRSAERNRRQYQLHLKDALGGRDASAITRRDVVAILSDIGIKAGKIQANRIQSLLSAAFQWAIDEGRIDIHPASRIRKQGKENARDRAATDDEIRAIWHATSEIAPQIGRVIRLLLITGQRRSEVCKSELVELAANAWTSPERRRKNKQPFHIVPLSRIALAEFHAACAESKGSPYVFQARKLTPSPMNDTTPSAAFAEMVRTLGIADFRLHDLRHVAATGMASMGVPPDIREMVANQVTGRKRTMGGRYDQHQYTLEKRRALRLWSLRLQEIVRGRKSRALRWHA